MATYDNEIITGGKKWMFHQYFKVATWAHYTGQLLTGKMSFASYRNILPRVLRVFNIIKVNKVVKVRGVYKMHIYLPAFPSRSCWVVLDKFGLMDKMPEEIPPASVLVSMTKACPYNCEHCYQKLDSTKEMDITMLQYTMVKLQELGVGYINIEGGEPLIRFERLMDMMKVIDDRAEVWVNTTGYKVTKEQIQRMKESGVFGVMISIHHPDPKVHDGFVRHKGAHKQAVKALKMFKKGGIATMINCTGTQDLVKDDGFDRIMDIAKDTGCMMVQLIHEKPAGGWMGKNDTMKPKYVKRLLDLHYKYNNNPDYLDYPPVSSQVFESVKQHFGCTAGGIERFYINVEGEVQPCEFVNVTFGNVMEEDFVDIYKRMRRFYAVPHTNWICCTEAARVAKEVSKLKKKKTPLPKKESAHVMKKFDFGKETELYKPMGLYKKR